MKNYSDLKKVALGISTCFTFGEAAEVLKPILGIIDFIGFMEHAGYLDRGVPKKYYIQKGVFKTARIGNNNVEDMSHCIDFFITKQGMVEILQKALRNYIRKQSPAFKLSPGYMF